LRDVLAGAGLAGDPGFMAALALAEGRRDDARAALVAGLATGDESSARALLPLAIEVRDGGALRALADRHPAMLPAWLGPVLEAERALHEGDLEKALRVLDEHADAIGAGDGTGWADDIRVRTYGSWLKASAALWPRVFETLHAEARDIGRLDLATRALALTAELQKPILLAIIGEFNAGKSTFINALLGVDVAPTGILPTTATLHRVAWAPDPFARVLVRGAADRTISHEALKDTLAKLQAEGASIDRVQIYAPIERLRWVEILDTPGFNAPNPEHARSARGAFDEAHAVVWLLDSTGAMKASEAAVLIEVRDRGLPIIVLMNKLDRIPQADAERAVDFARDGLRERGIPAHAGPIAFSAKLALAGRLGDTGALEKSRWAEVEKLLSEVVVDQADRLRELALRRRALRLGQELFEAASAQESEERGIEDAARVRASALRTAAARLFGSELETVATLQERLEQPRRALEADLRPVAELGPEARVQEEIHSYVTGRFVARLAPAVVEVLTALSGVTPPDFAQLAVAAALEGAATAASPIAFGEMFPSALRASVRAFAHALGREADRPVRRTRASASVQRLRALVKALGSGV
jgi:GTPase SAR1 family protein